ncbi:MAG: DUF502 domain-containing protein [Candidatus Competibacterales bacterium]
MPSSISSVMLRGLSIVLPLAIALYVVVWLARSAEQTAKGLLTTVLPEDYYLPGMGVLLLLALVFLTGLLMYPWLTRTLIDMLDRLLRKVPIMGSVYSTVKDLMDVLGGNMGQRLGRPVMVKVPNTEMETLGFVTRGDDEHLPEGFLPPDHLVVFVQWSSQVGGYCFIVPKDSVRELDITVEDGLRWSLTAGLSAPAPASIEPRDTPHGHD